MHSATMGIDNTSLAGNVGVAINTYTSTHAMQVEAVVPPDVVPPDEGSPVLSQAEGPPPSVISSSSSRAHGSTSDIGSATVVRGHGRGAGSAHSMPLPVTRDPPPANAKKAASAGSINPSHLGACTSSRRLQPVVDDASDIPSLQSSFRQHMADQAASKDAFEQSLRIVVENTTGLREGISTLDTHMMANMNSLENSLTSTLDRNFDRLEGVLDRSLLRKFCEILTCLSRLADLSPVIAHILHPQHTASSSRALLNQAMTGLTALSASVEAESREQASSQELQEGTSEQTANLQAHGHAEESLDKQAKGKARAS